MEQYVGSWLHVMVPVIIVLSIWELVWKYVAMWKAGRNNHLAWFICLAVFNTAGILPIVYIILQRKNKKKQTPVQEE